MLICAYFKLRDADRLYFFNPHNVLYIDEDGVLFAKDVYRQFAEGEYQHIKQSLAIIG